jgi:CRISPR type III-A-associated RAMP protein Csm4
MIQAIVLHNEPSARFRFGLAGLDQTALNQTSAYFHSDTLFSALVNSHAQVSNQTDTFVQKFSNTTLGVSSGCFCFVRGNSSVLFFHKPIFLNLLLEDSSKYKDFKNIHYISKRTWELGYSPAQILTECVVIDRKFVITHQELLTLGIDKEYVTDFRPISISVLPKVSIHTEEKTERLFFQASISLGNIEKIDLHTHFYFLVRDQTPSVITDSLLELMATNGIGGELNVGCGKADTISRQTVNFGMDFSTWQVSASLIFPSNIEEIQNISYYQTIIRGGRRLGRDGWLNEIRGFTEGCLIKASNLVTIGHTPNLSPTPQKKYLRYGRGFLLPISQNWERLLTEHEANYL